MKKRIPFPAALLAVLCLVLAGLATAARAGDVQVSAAVSDNDIQVGESTDYTITINGSTEAQVSQNIDVDGLTITYEGPNTQLQVSFGMGFGSGSNVVRSVIHTYSVVAQRGGDFVIPAQQVTVNGNTYKTQPVTLHVEGGGNTAQSGNGGNGGGGNADAQADQNGGLYYAEFVLPKSTAYIGEAVPFEVHLYVDARVRANLMELPEITAEGCTVEKAGTPKQDQVERNGRPYDMVTYKCAVTPVKAGQLSLGPVTVLAEMQLPMRRPRRMPGMNDPMFQNPFFDDAFQMMSPPQQVTIRGEPVPLRALPLPTEGMPASFAGAVGSYSMKTEVKPTMVQAGDPITISVSITGQGNFDKVTAPQFVDTDGWRTYPPSAKFLNADDIGIAGTKTFDIAAIPQTQKTSSPGLVWSYFDPDQQKYVTLTENGTPIKVEGQIQSSAAPVIVAQSPQPGGTKQTPAAQQAKADIEYIRADSTGWGASFAPLYMNRVFWAAQGAPLIALLAFAGISAARKRAADKEARRLAGLRREKEMAMAVMNRRDVPESELYQNAARVMRLEAAIQTGRDPETLDGAEVTLARALDPALAERVRDVFERQAEAMYAGAGGGRGAVSAERRVQAIETVKGYENAPRA